MATFSWSTLENRYYRIQKVGQVIANQRSLDLTERANLDSKLLGFVFVGLKEACSVAKSRFVYYLSNLLDMDFVAILKTSSNRLAHQYQSTSFQENSSSIKPSYSLKSYWFCRNSSGRNLSTPTARSLVGERLSSEPLIRISLCLQEEGELCFG